MAHSVAEAAARAVKNSQKKVVETRTPEQRLIDIRKNRAAKLFVTPEDQDFLLNALDAALALLKVGDVKIATLEAKLEEFRQVYEAENQQMAVKVERVVDESTEL